MKKASQSKMKIAIFVIIVSLCSVPFVYSMEKNIGGQAWYKTKWGMSVDEVNKSLGDTIVKTKDGDGEYKNIKYQYVLPNFKIGSFSFSVYFAFKSGDRLYDIMVKKEGGDRYYACFLELEDSLIKKYGKPFSVKDEDNRRFQSQMRSREWMTEDSVITLNNAAIWVDKRAHEITNIFYSARESGDDKL